MKRLKGTSGMGCAHSFSPECQTAKEQDEFSRMRIAFQERKDGTRPRAIDGSDTVKIVDQNSVSKGVLLFCEQEKNDSRWWEMKEGKGKSVVHPKKRRENRTSSASFQLLPRE
jgi:hypothetical protein